MIEPAKYRFRVWRGATFRKNLVYLDQTNNPKNVTGYTGIIDIRENPDSLTSLMTLTDANGGLTFGTTNGTIEIFIDSTDTELIAWNSAYYDFKVTTPSTDTDVLLYGNFTIYG